MSEFSPRDVVLQESAAGSPRGVVSFEILSGDKESEDNAWKKRIEFVLFVLNMAKNVLGSLILLLPWTISRCGWALGAMSTALVGVVCAYTFTLIARCCDHHHVVTYPEIFRKVYPDKPWVPHVIDISIVILNFCTVVSFTIVAGDTLPSVLEAWLGVERPSWGPFVAILSLTVLFPVSIPRDLSSIRHISFVGIIGLIFIVLSSVVLLFKKGVSSNVSPVPQGLPIEVFSAFTIIGGVFDAHTNAPGFYKESVLDRGVKMKSFTKAVYCCMTIVFIAAMTFSMSGYLTFGLNAKDNILESYQELYRMQNGDSSFHVISTMSFFAALSVIISYALFFNALRQSITRLFLQVVPDRVRTRFEPNDNEHPDQYQSTCVYRGLEILETLVIIAISSTIAYFVKDSFGFFVACVWSIFGSMTVYILPSVAALYSLPRLSKLERVAISSILTFGIVFSAGFGFVTTVIQWAHDGSSVQSSE